MKGSGIALDCRSKAVDSGNICVIAEGVTNTAVLRKVDAATVCWVPGIVMVLVPIDPVPLIAVVKGTSIVDPPPMVDGAITEESVDVMETETVLTTVEAGMVMVELKNTMLVDTPVLVDTGGVVVKVVVKVSTTPHPEGIMDGPAGKHDERPGY